MASFVSWLVIVPEHVPRAGIDCPDIVWHSEVKYGVNMKRSRFACSGLICLKRPCKSKVRNILRSNLRELAVQSAGVISMVAGPALRRRMIDGGRIKVLRNQGMKEARKSESCKNQRAFPEIH